MENITISDIYNLRNFLVKKEATAPSKWCQLYYGHMIGDIDKVLQEVKTYKDLKRL